MVRASLCLLVLAAACAHSEKQGSKSPAELHAVDYAPLRVGATYVYDMQFGQTGEMTVQFVGEKDGYVVDSRNGAFRHTPEGLRDRDRYLIKHPIAPGTKWKIITGPSAVENYEIVSAGEQCSSAAGKFADCLVVHSWIPANDKVTIHITWSWARDIGLVKVETAAEIRGQGRVPQTKQSLKHYRFAPAAASPAAPAEEGAPGWESE